MNRKDIWERYIWDIQERYMLLECPESQERGNVLKRGQSTVTEKFNPIRIKRPLGGVSENNVLEMSLPLLRQ